jgi:hypothetical protein
VEGGSAACRDCGGVFAALAGDEPRARAARVMDGYKTKPTDDRGVVSLLAEAVINPTFIVPAKKPNGFLTFICALIPGAGQMLLGFMARGSALMFTTVMLSSLSIAVGMEMDGIFAVPFAALAGVLYFFAFFDALKLRRRLISAMKSEEVKYARLR